MRTETQTVRIGEWLGPVDWSYDFAAHGWDRGGSGCNPARITDWIALLRAVEEGLARSERWAVYEHGSEREVLSVGMYDGWPYWKPTPCYAVRSWMGGDRVFWNGPIGAYRIDQGQL